MIIARERGRGEVLDAVLDPFHRLAGDDRGHRRTDVAGIGTDLVAKTAADIADQAPTLNDDPRAKGPAAGPNVATKTLYDQQQKLTVLYNGLEERRKKLNPKDKNALAAFNRAAEQYSREVAAFNSSNNGGNAPPAAKPSVPPLGSPPAAGAR